VPKLPTLLFLLGSMSFCINDREHLNVHRLYSLDADPRMSKDESAAGMFAACSLTSVGHSAEMEGAATWSS